MPRLAVLIGAEAASLAVMSALHLTAVLDPASGSSGPSAAGIAEALICVALVGGAVALARGTPRARPIALATIAFAIAGFVIGLSFTVSGGDAIDLAYHAIGLPLLLATFLLVRSPRPTRRR